MNIVYLSNLSSEMVVVRQVVNVRDMCVYSLVEFEECVRAHVHVLCVGGRVYTHPQSCSDLVSFCVYQKLPNTTVTTTTCV